MKSLLQKLRTLLVLGRVSNLPTVSSNLLASSMLNGTGIAPAPLAFLLLGGSLLYLGGMFLNDFCDAAFDLRYCPERPIPAGKISRRAVGLLAGTWFMAGFLCLAPLGWRAAGLALLLMAAIILYDFRHKGILWAPMVMGFCRFLLYPLAASAGANISSVVILCGAILGLYVAGITYLARGESRPDKPARWALLLLVLPVVAGFGKFLLGPGRNWAMPQPSLLFFTFLLLAWMGWLLVPLWRKTNRSIARVVSGLLAGVVLVDSIPASSALGWPAGWFLLLFAFALLLQRVIPAT